MIKDFIPHPEAFIVDLIDQKFTHKTTFLSYKRKYDQI